jgi:hypothetical protein
MSLRMPAMFAAEAVALNAITGSRTMHMVDDMRTKAEELLARDDDLRRAILAFATQYEVLKRDEYGLKVLGEQLRAAVATALNPEAVPRTLRHRADIDD